MNKCGIISIKTDKPVVVAKVKTEAKPKKNKAPKSED